MADSPDLHLLRQLAFPARYEALIDRVGAEVARLLVEPASVTQDAIKRAALAVKARHEGLFSPIYAESGTGKTTLANNLSRFLPDEYTPTVTHSGEVSTESLLQSLARATEPLPATDRRVCVINIDDRESDPPSSTELAAIKRFVRHPAGGNRSLIVWPETSLDIANQIAGSYREIAGPPAIPLPITVEGPPLETWPDIAIETLRLSNHVEGLEQFGMSIDSYDPSAYRTIGEYLRAMADDFVSYVHEILEDTRVPVSLVVLFVSESPNAGVLTQLTHHAKFGLADPRALVDATKDSVIGRWWGERPGLLIPGLLAYRPDLAGHAVIVWGGPAIVSACPHRRFMVRPRSGDGRSSRQARWAGVHPALATERGEQGGHDEGAVARPGQVLEGDRTELCGAAALGLEIEDRVRKREPGRRGVDQLDGFGEDVGDRVTVSDPDGVAHDGEEGWEWSGERQPAARVVPGEEQHLHAPLALAVLAAMGDRA